MNGSEGYSVVSERVNFENMYTDVAVKPVSPLETSNESGATTLKEHDYIGLSEVSSATSSSNKQPEGGRGGEALDLNESATVLRLGPPAVPKPEFPKPAVRASQRNNPILEEFREAQAMKAATQHATPQHYEQQGEELKSDRGAVYHPNGAYPAPCYRHHTPYNVFPGVKNNGVKRGFSETVGMHHHLTAREAHCDVSGTEQQPDVKAKLQQGNTMWMSNHSSHNLYNVQRRTLVQDAGDSSTKKHSLKNEAMASSDQPSSPAQNQTVGWPPVRSFLRNNNPVKPAPPPPTPTTAVQEKDTPPSTNSKSCFVKIYMDGVPFGRKVDLRTNNKYEKLYSALEEMFQQFISGHYSGNQTSSSTNSQFVSSSSSRKLNFLDGSEYVLIYEDHEGDFMLVGDVPWELFVNTVKRLRIMKGSEDVNLAPKSADPVKSQPAVG